ncbi:hypothetical protein AVEN_225407-1, partial [Araneus ventricosus]
MVGSACAEFEGQSGKITKRRHKFLGNQRIAIILARANIPLQMFRQPVESMPRRISAV